MDSSEEESSLFLDYYIDSHRYDNMTPFHNSDKIFLNKQFDFGFLSISENKFYLEESFTKCKMKIKSTKYLELSHKNNGKKIKFNFNLIENFPSLIHLCTSDFFNSSEDNRLTHSIILSFQKPPRITIDKNEFPSMIFTKYLNQYNNLLNLDCPYRNILIHCINYEDIIVLRSKIFFSSQSEIFKENIKLDSFENFLFSIEQLKNDIDSIALNKNFGDENEMFYDKYIAYANISENLQRRKAENVCSLYKNFQKDFKLVKYSQKFSNSQKQPQNRNAFFILKHVQITPFQIIIKKENFHQSSRFLRLYYNNDNFLKIEFKDENDTQLYTNTPTTKTLSSLYSLIFKNGINLCGKKYVFFLNPTNSMRSNSLWMLEENESKTHKEFYYRELGLYSLLTSSSLSFSKLLSRLSQNFTSTLAYDGHFISEIENDVVGAEKNYIFNDGCGMISLDLLKEICSNLNKGVYASAIQVRYKGAKGVLVVNPTIEGKKIILTKSMVKFNCENTNDLEIIRFSRYSPGYLNLQIIILLVLNGIKKKTIFKFAKKEVASYRYKKNISMYHNQPQFDKIMNDIEKQNKLLNIQKEYMSIIAKSSYIYNRLSNISKRYRFHLKKCAFLIGVFDFAGILKENEVYVQIEKPNGKKSIITGDIIITKNPCLSLYDIQKVKGINHPYFNEHFSNVIVFPSKGDIPLPSKITGSDLDGDVYWVCWERTLLNVNVKEYAFKAKALKNEEPFPLNTISVNKKGERVCNVYFNVHTESYRPQPNMSFDEKCLDFHCYFHSNYKLPEVNKNYLSLVSNMMKRNQYLNMEFNDELMLEKLAFYHSIEVDFQKTGETSDFKNNLFQPQFLKKKELRRRMNFLVKLKEISDEYKYSEEFRDKRQNVSFYDYLSRMVNTNSNKNIDHSFLRLYEKKEIDKEMYKRSFIYKIYELVSYTATMKEAFITSIDLMSEEFFYQAKLKDKKFCFRNSTFESLKEIFEEVKEINSYYESEIKYIMMENEVLSEIEMVYLTDFIEPKIAIFKNDIEDYKINLNEQIRFIKGNCIQRLTEVTNKHKISKEEVEDILFIIIFWICKEKININDNLYDISEIIQRRFSIKDKKEFIEEIIMEKSIDNMKYYFFDRMKCITLYTFFVKNTIV